jgi:hypothetical protein
MLARFGNFLGFFLVSADDPHVSFECWWVPILDKPTYNVLFLPSKKIHNIWGLK